MIHTFELIQAVDLSQVQNLLMGFEFTTAQIDTFYHSPGKICSCSCKLGKNHPVLGLKQITVLKQQDTILAGISYYCILRIEPQMLLVQDKTVELFESTQNNIQRLSDQFHMAMNLFIDDIGCANLVNLSDWKCRRIDYTTNLQFNSDDDARLFLDMTKKTSMYTRKEKKVLKGFSVNEQSTAEGNKSLKNIFYDKSKQVAEVYVGIADDVMHRLIDEARNIIRFEVQCKKHKVISLKEKYGLASRGILEFLNEDIAHDLLVQQYEQTVGNGDFYSLYHAKKRIDASSFGPKKKSDLVNILQLIAQARHVDIARDQFIAGGMKIKRTDIVVEGSKNTFQNRLKDIASLNINPVLIPKDRKCTFLCNPVVQIQNQ